MTQPTYPFDLVSISARQNVIYFATNGGGIKVYSEETNDVETIFNSTDALIGVAWDAMDQQIYFSAFYSSKIYRSNANGTEVVPVLSSSTCK